MRRQQVAFDALSEQRRRCGIGLQLVTSQTLANPGRQARQIDWPYLHEHAALFHRAHPAGALCAAVELRRDDQHQRVGRPLVRELDDRVGALLARRGIRHADLDDLALGEQRHRAAAGNQALPVETAFDDVQLALLESLLARRGADGIRGFVDEQRLVSGHEIDRLELTGQAGCEVVAGNLHFRSAGRRGRDGAEDFGSGRSNKVDPGKSWADYGPSRPARP